MTEKTYSHCRAMWDHAMLALMVAQPGLGGEALLAAVINEANDALARLKEAGMLKSDDQ